MQTYLIVVEFDNLKGYLAMVGEEDVLVAKDRVNASVFSGEQVEELIPELRAKNPQMNFYQEEFKVVNFQ